MSLQVNHQGMSSIGPMSVSPQTIVVPARTGSIQGHAISSEQTETSKQVNQAATETLKQPAVESSISFKANSQTQVQNSQDPIKQLMMMADGLKGTMKLQMGAEGLVITTARNSFFGTKGKSDASQEAVRHSLDTIKTHLNYANAKEALNLLDSLQNNPTAAAVLNRNSALQAEFKAIQYEAKFTQTLDDAKQQQTFLFKNLGQTEMNTAVKYMNAGREVLAKSSPEIFQHITLTDKLSQVLRQEILSKPTVEEQTKAMEMGIRLVNKALQENDLPTAQSIWVSFASISDLKEAREALPPQMQNALQGFGKLFKVKQKMVDRFAGETGTKVPPMATFLHALNEFAVKKETDQDTIKDLNLQIRLLKAREEGQPAVEKLTQEFKSALVQVKDEQNQLLTQADDLKRRIEFQTDAYNHTKMPSDLRTLQQLQKSLKTVEKQIQRNNYEISDLNENLAQVERDHKFPGKTLDELHKAVEAKEKFIQKIDEKLAKDIFTPMSNWQSSIAQMPAPVLSDFTKQVIAFE